MKKRTGTGTNIIKCLFGIMVAGVFLYLILGEILMPAEDTGSNYQCEEFSADWTWVKQDGTRVPIEIPGRCDVKRNEVVTIEAVLPEGIENHSYLCFRCVRQDIEIYVDGELRQKYTTEDIRPFGKTSAAAYVFLALEEADSGKLITVVTRTDSAYTGIFYTIYYGNQMGIWNYFFKQYGAEIVIAVVMLILGLISVVSSIILRFYYHKKIELEYLGWGIVLAAVWLIANSTFRQLIFPSITIINDIPFYMIMLLPLSFMIYMNGIQKGRYHRPYIVVEALVILNFAVCTLLQITNIRDYVDTIVLMAVICLTSIMLMGVTIILDVWKGYIREYRLAAVGVLGTALASIAQLILYFCKTIPFNGYMIAAGLLFLLLTASINAIQDMVHMEKEKQQAILASESKARFLANMSHEIRTPINAVLGMDEMILRESMQENITEYAQDIQSAGRSLLSLINDILDFSRIDSGKLEIVPVEYELSSLINDCYNMIFLRAKEKNLKFEIENDPAVPGRLYGDEVRIRQIIINLLTNAVKYTRQGMIKLSVHGEWIDEKRILLKIAVADTGIGITKENQEKLFASFQRVEEDRNRNIEGTGLGLAITKQLVELMNGKVWVESEYERGSVFYVELPQGIVSEKQLGNFSVNYMSSSDDGASVSQSFRAPKGRILVVDDVPMNLKVMKGLLRHTGLQIDTAQSGKECIELICRKRYHIIFLDHMMPEMDGIETLHYMKKINDQLNQDTPVVMLTANAIMGAKEAYLEEGFCDYLSKPIREKELEEMILKYLPAELVKKTAKRSEDEEKNLRRDQEKGPEKAPWKVPLNNSLEGLTALDTAAGLRECEGDREYYLEVLTAYLENDRSNALKVLYERQDWTNYRIQVNALKSTSRSVGALKLADHAEQLEHAVKEGNIAYIHEHHGAVLQEYRRLAACVKNEWENGL